MATYSREVVCECGKKYTVSDPHFRRSSIRCHICGRVVKLPILKVSAAESRTERALRASYAGLRFDGVYRGSAAVENNSCFADALELSLRFKSDLIINYEFRAMAYDDGVPSEVDQDSGEIEYEVTETPSIRFSFDATIWICEFEGFSQGNMLVLAFRIEEYFGLSSGPKCVYEGEVSLQFALSLNGP